LQQFLGFPGVDWGKGAKGQKHFVLMVDVRSVRYLPPVSFLPVR
jgi:hypothetical protein